MTHPVTIILTSSQLILVLFFYNLECRNHLLGGGPVDIGQLATETGDLQLSGVNSFIIVGWMMV